MESLNDLIWTDEDDEVLSTTSGIMHYVACLTSCGGKVSNCGDSYGPGIIADYCARAC